MQRLVAGDSVVDDVALSVRPEVERFQRTIRRDGVRDVQGPGVLRRDCPSGPNIGAGDDCFDYRLRGEQVIPVGGRIPINARFRLWVDYEDGAWQALTYSYSVVPEASG